MTRLLHGLLIAKIYETTKLRMSYGKPFMSQGSEDPLRIFRALIYRIKGCYSQQIGYKIYTSIDLDSTRVGNTIIVDRPRWFQSFRIYCAHEVSSVTFKIQNDNLIGTTVIGNAYLPVDEIINGDAVDKWLDILDARGKPIGSQIRVSVQFRDVIRDPNWSRGIQGPKFAGVPFTFFEQRRGCKVTLYQDSHISNNFKPEIRLAGGMTYKPQRCWQDIFDAITNAKYLICITGWSMHTDITLIRDFPSPKHGNIRALSLGELLKKKADEDNLNVYVLLWQERTSKWLKKGLEIVTGNQGNSVVNYFKNTKVRCIECTRMSDGGKTKFEQQEIMTMFSHHQKSVVVDCEDYKKGSQKRRIVSFVGGLDLTIGRYDTQDHSLFRTLNTVHKDDYYQPSFSEASIRKGGPRQPWHDIHCRLEGPVAWDVLYNFEQRWWKQVQEPLIFCRDQLCEPQDVITPIQDKDSWSVQVFRSIDGGSVVVSPLDPEEAFRRGLHCDKNNVTDRSIQEAYINAIRRARNFIYIENQFFIGSSYGWKQKEDNLGALNLIPKELSLKIVSKIMAGEQFSVYVVLPMWPEGVPESPFIQEILYCQRKTMEMMFTDIATAINRKGIDAHPTDYLSFFCLGNCEVVKPGEYEPPEKPNPDTAYCKAQHSRRFMIYVHSKMMIVDDEYIIIGSANMNQRSMDGGRDTEIAMGAYQLHHLSVEQPAKGQIHGFRMALWYEHLSIIHPSFLHPETKECMHKVNEIANDYWKIYSSDRDLDKDLPGHLLRYPIKVTGSGQITALSPEEKYFPDTKASVLGDRYERLSALLIT